MKVVRLLFIQKYKSLKPFSIGLIVYFNQLQKQVIPVNRVSDVSSLRRRRGAAARRGGGARCRARGSPRTPPATGREFRSGTLSQYATIMSVATFKRRTAKCRIYNYVNEWVFSFPHIE